MSDLPRGDLPPVGVRIPLLFTYRDTLIGNGFVVEVQARNGRALRVREPDGFWMYGVNPGGMAANGDDPDAAHAAFRRTFSNILVDLVLEAGSFEAFRSAVEDFFNETNEGYEPDWLAAVEAVRRNEVGAAELPRAPAGSPRGISVSMKRTVRAEDNRADLEARLAARWAPSSGSTTSGRCLDNCARGHSRKESRESWAVSYRGKTYRSSPLGKHGRRHNLRQKPGTSAAWSVILGSLRTARPHTRTSERCPQ